MRPIDCRQDLISTETPMAAKQNRKRTSKSRKTVSVLSSADAAALAALSDDDLLETVQRQTFNFFWEGAHPQSGLAFDRCTARRERTNHKTAVGGSGFGVMAIIVAAAGAQPTSDELTRHCRDWLGGFKVPRKFAFVETLPRSALGKVLKTTLRQDFAAGLDATRGQSKSPEPAKAGPI